MSLHQMFHDTIVLAHPHYLHATPNASSNVVVWFSDAERGAAGERVPVCVVKVVEQRFVLSPQPHGQLTAVSGPCRMVGKTLFVFASSLSVCKGPAIVGPTPDKPAPFSSSVWPTLICAGVVSTPELAAVQPLLTVVDFTLPRRRTVVDVPVTIRCTASASAGEREPSSAATRSDTELIVILGKLTARKTARDGTELLVDVHDVRVGGRNDEHTAESPKRATRWATIRSWWARVISLWRETTRYNLARELDVDTVVAAHVVDVEYPWPAAHTPRLCVIAQGEQRALGLAVSTHARA